MPDDADITENHAALYTEFSLYQSRRSTPTIAPMGECYFCGSPVPDNARWCDAQCRDDWQSDNGIN